VRSDPPSGFPKRTSSFTLIEQQTATFIRCASWRGSDLLQRLLHLESDSDRDDRAAQESEPLFGFMRELDQSFKPRERSDYLPDWPGFATVFGTRKTAAAKRCRVELEPDLDALLRDAEMPHLLLADRLVRAIQQIEAFRTDFDVLYIYLPQRWQPGFKGAADDFDLHDHLKAYTAARGIPLQIVREDKAIAYSCRASVMASRPRPLRQGRRRSLEARRCRSRDRLYRDFYSVRPVESDRPRFVTCCSQVFDADGSGLEFVAYDTNDVEVQRENPLPQPTRDVPRDHALNAALSPPARRGLAATSRDPQIDRV
jgi:hypothetical protein